MNAHASSWRSTALALLAMLASGAVLAAATGTGNIGFLQDAPLTRFQGADLSLFQAQLRESLDNDADGKTRHWNNAKTGSSGEIRLVKSFERDDRRCRQTEITNRAYGYAQARSDMVFCKTADGQWKVESKSPATDGAKQPRQP